MKKKILQENMWCFQFEAATENHLGTNIYALIDNSEVLLLDSGYKEHLREVLVELKGYNVNGIVPSHFHPDHIDGIRLIENPVVYGNAFAEETIKLYMSDDLERLNPNKIIRDKDSLQFGDFTLTFYHAPGHSECSMLIDINNTYLHVGDLYMTRNSGTDVLPYVVWKNISKHIESLQLIDKLESEKLLLSHGNVVLTENVYKDGIKNRIIYLKAILDSDNTCSTDEALKSSTKSFAFKKWREDIKKDL